MTVVKSIYIYFLSIKKLLIKSIKEFIFTTNFYNKFLDSKIQTRFFFYPNPYLLSPLLNHKDLLLKISKFEANYFWNDSNKSDNEKKKSTQLLMVKSH